MRLPSRLIALACALLALGLVVAIVLGHFSGGSTPSGARQPTGGLDGAAFPPGLRAYGFTLRDQRGRAVSLSDYRGQVVALAFLSSDCRTCVLVAQQVRGALDELGATRGVATIFVSADPKTDTPASVRRFLAETSLTGRVRYLTGSLARLRAVWHAYRVPPPSLGTKDSEAAVMVLLIDRAGIERDGFGLEQITPESLAHDIRLLQANRG